MQKVMENMQAKLRFRSLDNGDHFTWCGRLIAQRDQGIAVTCPNTAAKLRPIPLTMTKKKHREALASNAEINQLQSILGSLNWVARVCRPDTAYQLSALQAAAWPHIHLTAGIHLLRSSRTLALVSVDLDMLMCCHGDQGPQTGANFRRYGHSQRRSRRSCNHVGGMDAFENTWDTFHSASACLSWPRHQHWP